MKLPLFNLSRRSFINWSLAAVGNLFFAGYYKPVHKRSEKLRLSDCLVRPEQTEGPYFRDEKLNRSDIRIDPSDNSVVDGIPFNLEFHVSQTNGADCVPLEGALVDVWHCDALGIYSDVFDPNFDTRGKKFLRGYQVTDNNGIAGFTTIYPGWYQGRAVHIHFKIRTNPTSDEGYEFTSQIYFDDNVSDEVFQNEPYSSKGQQRVKNNNDGIYRNGGDKLLIPVTKIAEGFSGVFEIALQIDSQTDVGSKTEPGNFMLSQNYPNPFNSSTAIKFVVPAAGYVTLKIYNAFGAEITTLINSIFSPGEYNIDWEAENYPSGVYYYRLKSNSFEETKKLVLMK